MCDEKSFDELVKLFAADPDEFEEYRKEYIDQKITEMCAVCPEHLERCQRFQWRLEQQLNKYKNPIARYNAMVVIFWKQVEEFKYTVKYSKPQTKKKQNATIIQFGPKG